MMKLKIKLRTKRIIIVVAFVTVTAFATVVAFALLLIIFRLGFFVQRRAAPVSPAPHEARSSPRASPMTGQFPSPQAPPAGRETPENRTAAEPVETVAMIESGGSGALTIPVAGIRPEQLRDTYNESRSEGRTHNALDIMASCGAPVVAAATGKIIKLLHSERGGVTIYQIGSDNRMVYYYAHLERYADNLAEGRLAQQREVIGYVGDTGNAGAGACHLHFAMWTTTDPKRYWSGENINPYPLLRPAP